MIPLQLGIDVWGFSGISLEMGLKSYVKSIVEIKYGIVVELTRDSVKILHAGNVRLWGFTTFPSFEIITAIKVYENNH